MAPLGRVRYVQLERGSCLVCKARSAELGRTVVCRCGADRNRMEQIDTVPGRITLFRACAGRWPPGNRELRRRLRDMGATRNPADHLSGP